MGLPVSPAGGTFRFSLLLLPDAELGEDVGEHLVGDDLATGDLAECVEAVAQILREQIARQTVAESRQYVSDGLRTLVTITSCVPTVSVSASSTIRCFTRSMSAGSRQEMWIACTLSVVWIGLRRARSFFVPTISTGFS